MITERARVIALEDGYAWVETERQTACGACSVKQGCGTATVAKIWGGRRSQLRVINELPLQIGNEVLIGVSEGALVQGSLAVYLLPLLLLLLGAGGGDLLFAHDSMAIAGGLLGLAAGLLWLRTFTDRVKADPRFQPVVLECLSSGFTAANDVVLS